MSRKTLPELQGNHEFFFLEGLELVQAGSGFGVGYVIIFFLFSRYGIGMIYYKQEKFNLAEIHFRKALSINPSSSVLYCHVGVVS